MTTAERLEALEARALAAEITIANARNHWDIVAPDTFGLSPMGKILQSVDIAAAREILRKAGEWDALTEERSIFAQMLGLISTSMPNFECAGPHDIEWAHRFVKAVELEYDALAAQTLQLREALECVNRIENSDAVKAIYTIASLHGHPYNGETWETPMASALALDIPTATKQVEAWKSDSELLEWLFADADEWGTSNLTRCRGKWNGEDSFLAYCRAQFEAKEGE